MRILFITFSDIKVCSSSNIRNVSLIKGFLDLGHTVDIISYKLANKAVLIDDSFTPIVSKCGIIEMEANLSTEKVSSSLLSSGDKSIKRKIYHKLRKLYYSLEPVDSMRKIANEIDLSALELKDYDLMISSSNPYSGHILADRIRNKFYHGKLRWIQYWGDALFLDTLTRRPLFPFAVKKAERKLISKCDKVVYTNGVVLELQQKFYPEFKDKMSFVETPYAFYENDTAPTVYDVGYFGSYSSSVRDIMPLYTVLKNLRNRSIIVGNGDQMIESINRLTVRPRASVNEVSELEKRTRVLVCVCNKLSSKGETGLIPGKVYHYGATKKEILVIGATPKVKDYLSKYERFAFVDNEEEKILESLKSILETEQRICTEMAETIPCNAAKAFLK
ncbi:MAG: hypothetical protein IJR89_06955 [Clostridia bacterium]|nr:hypothetical protein [Clostridia bacterium]